MQDLPYFKAFPSDWEQAMRRADIPAAERGEVYRLIFFAWADGGLNWDDEQAMRRYAREMGWQWRRFARTLAHYKRLCPADSSLRLPVFLLRNLKQNLPEVVPDFNQSSPEVSSDFDSSLSQVSPQFESSLIEVSSQFDAQIEPKSFSHGEAKNTCHSHSHSHSHSQRERDTRACEGPAPPQQSITVVETQSVVGRLAGPNDDFDSDLPPEREWTLGERFILKACQLWGKPILETDWKLRQTVQGFGKWVEARVDPKQQKGGRPEWFQEFWFQVLKRTIAPRPEYLIEQWDAYDRWLVETYEPHRQGASA